MASVNPKWVTHWSRVREQGVWRYVLLRGTLAFGVLLSAALWLLDAYVFNRPFDLSKVFFATVVGGTLWGAGMWGWGEHLYRKHLRDSVS